MMCFFMRLTLCLIVRIKHRTYTYNRSYNPNPYTHSHTHTHTHMAWSLFLMLTTKWWLGHLAPISHMQCDSSKHSPHDALDENDIERTPMICIWFQNFFRDGRIKRIVPAGRIVNVTCHNQKRGCWRHCNMLPVQRARTIGLRIAIVMHTKKLPTRLSWSPKGPGGCFPSRTVAIIITTRNEDNQQSYPGRQNKNTQYMAIKTCEKMSYGTCRKMICQTDKVTVQLEAYRSLGVQ